VTAYQELERRCRVQSHLAHAAAILGWDEATMMPPGGGEARGEAMAALAELRHERATDPAWIDLFATCERESLDDWQRRNLELMRRRHRRATALPRALVGARTRARVACEQAWRRQRKDNDWQGHLPLLGEVVRLEREVAQALAAALDLDPYDALIDGYDPGMRRAAIDPLFHELAAFLPDFIERALETSKTRSAVRPKGPFPIDRQRALGVDLMRAIGFDFDRGRLDVSHHPFCGGVPQDVRITTRYDEQDFTTSLMGVLHETGHAKYDQGRPREWIDQPVGMPAGMALHESQSLLHEMQVCRGRPFLEFAAPKIRDTFPEAVAREPEAFTAENLVRLGTHVERSLIRVDADEATYPCHVLLRYEIERDLVAGRLAVADIPGRWNEAMLRLLGLDTRGNYKDGPMQDVHWPSGAIGYFPSYTLGAMIAAQLMVAARRDLAELDADIARGDLRALDAWLRERVWSQGMRWPPLELVERATGAPLGTAAYRAHLERRYAQGE
jgi:carboxypeptidase Taq